MKKILMTLLCLITITSSLYATVTGDVVLYFDNGTVSYTDTQTFYEFDVKAYIENGSGTNIFKEGMVYVEYDTTVFGTNVVSNGKLVSVTKLGPLAATSGLLYRFLNDPNNGIDRRANEFVITFEATNPYSPATYGSSTYISASSASLTSLMRIKLEVSASGSSSLAWPDSVPDINNVFRDLVVNDVYESLVTANATESTSIVYSNSGDPALPVTLSQLSAQYVDNKVAVSWVTESETENLGFVLKRAIKYSDDELSEYTVVSSYLYNDDLIGAGTTAEQHVYSYYDSDVKPGVNYSYILVDVDYNGDTEEHGPVSIIIPENLLFVSDDYNLGVNYPNPFNPSFTIPFELMTGMNVNIAMYDITGKKVMAIANGYFEPRQYQLRVNASDLNSGIYFIRTMIGDQVQTQKMTLLK